MPHASEELKFAITTATAPEKLKLLNLQLYASRITKLRGVKGIKTLLLSEQEVVGLLSIEQVLQVVESAFRESALGYSQMLPKLHHR